MIRKSAIILIVIVGILASISVFILGDSFVQDIAEAALGKVLKTEVEIEGLDVELTTTNATFKGLKIKDPENLSRNLTRTGSAKFDVLGMQLLAKKLVIKEMSLNDVIIDSEMKKLDRTSEVNQDSVEASLGDLSKNLPDLDLDVLAKEMDIEQFIHPEKLKSIVAIKKAEQEGQERIARWNETLKNNTVEADIRQIQIEADNLRNSNPKTFQDYQKAIERLKKLESKTKKTVNQINELQKNANNDLSFVTTNFDNIKELTEEDIKNSEKLANLKEINATHIGMMLFGKQFVGRYQQAMGYLEIARGYFGEKEEKPKRKQGRFITFPVTSIVYPEFLIQRLHINGQLTEQTQPLMNWAGSVTDLTLDQKITGKPTVFDILGDEIGKPAKYHIQGVFDNRGENDVYTLTLKGSQLEMQKVEMKKDDKTWPNHMSSKDVELKISMTLNQVTMEGHIQLVAKSVQFGFKGKKDKKISETDLAVRETFEDLKSVEVNSSIKGQLDNPQFSVSSNIDSILAKRLDAMVGKKINEARTKIRNNIEGQVNQQRKDAEKSLNAEKQKVLKIVNGYQDQVQKEKENLDKQAKAFENKQKKALEKAVEDEARKALQNLFK